MDILIETTRLSSRTKKYQRGYSFRTDEKKGKKPALEWDDLRLQEQLKYLMYIDRTFCGYPNKDNSIDELKPKNCMHLKRNTKSKFFIGIK